MHQNVSQVKAAVCSGRVAQSSIASDRLMSIPIGTVVDNDESASDVQSPDGCKHCIAADFVKAVDHKTANAVVDDGPKDTNQLHGLDVVDGHTVEGPVVGTLTSIACGDEPSVVNPLCVDDFMYPPSKETVASQFLYSCGRRLVNVTHDSQNLSENSICSTDEEVGSPTRQGARNGISNNNSSIASTAEHTSIATNIASCDVLDKIATVILDTHAESSPKVADHDLTHASPSTTVPATNTPSRVADGTHGDEVPELKGCFAHASTVRMPTADSQSKSPSMQSFARGIPNKYGQESLDDIEYRQLIKELKIKSCKTKAWEPTTVCSLIC